MIDLRQSTAGQEVNLGRFVDATDGNTEETGLTIANTDIKLWKTGATTLADKNSGGATHIANGIYYCVLDATDTNTIGPMSIEIHVSGALPQSVECRVLSAAQYDALYGTVAFSTLAASALANLDATVSSRLASSAYTAPDSAAVITDAVWDEVLTAATHNVASSAGRRVRQLASTIIYDGIAVSSTENTITLGAGAASTDGAYDPGIVAIVGGTGLGQSRLILQYAGAARTAVVDRDWKVNPDATSEYVIIASEGREHVNEGAAQAGGASTITLNASASASDDAYIGQVIFLRSGTGEDQARRVIDYVGSTKIATVDSAWDTVPASGTGYVMLPSAVTPKELGDIHAAVDTLPADIWAETVGPATAANVLKAIVAAVLAKTSGAGTGNITIRNIADSANLVAAVVDEVNGNRTSVTITWGNA